MKSKLNDSIKNMDEITIAAEGTGSSGYPKAAIDMEKTGIRIRELAEMNNLSPEDLMGITGVTTKQAVYRWFRGETLPSIENMLTLSRAMNLTGIEEMLAFDYI